MTVQNQALNPISNGDDKGAKNVIQSFIVEQFSKLSLHNNLGLNSRIKRTFTRP
jgi:hypothetical protein